MEQDRPKFSHLQPETSETATTEPVRDIPSIEELMRWVDEDLRPIDNFFDEFPPVPESDSSGDY